MVIRSAAKQKMWSLSRYKPGFLTLKHGERAMRPLAVTLEMLPEQRFVQGAPAFKDIDSTSIFQRQAEHTQ